MKIVWSDVVICILLLLIEYLRNRRRGKPQWLVELYKMYDDEEDE